MMTTTTGMRKMVATMTKMIRETTIGKAICIMPPMILFDIIALQRNIGKMKESATSGVLCDGSL